MNNTTRTLAIAAILAATLVVGGMLATTTTIATQSAFAYPQMKKVAQYDDKGKHNGGKGGNGNTDTDQNCNNNAYTSGLDPEVNENCEPLICTHPNNNGTCSEEGVVTSSTITSAAGNNTVPTPKTCQECFTSILTPTQISAINALAGNDQVANVCERGPNNPIDESAFIGFLTQPGTGISLKQANDLVACLKTFGIVFVP